jgi:hypothetical protein
MLAPLARISIEQDLHTICGDFLVVARALDFRVAPWKSVSGPFWSMPATNFSRGSVPG